ncbi:hypothetical protein CONPUDRAFT_89105 [Coniophora puteana RWD-64-598 SS2]|uniref:Trafficking protein particle complex II-specific subunit 65 IgD3 domain-containing protein n=1 Tax=Coniophora puteana (strain RWD-64-598) TaxID=741705 RepID=A0A5M3MVS1_CONPW|nr:uncharacterized protein CONPUDRAFT_89105 [Coniophora puteana RWD-64-598 SS2]EIW83117.1 hypothetical protein CONPUDRAFT_89105 [Coniophora puteana RWD-64-598 SS2]
MPISASQSNHPFIAYLSSAGLLGPLKSTFATAEQLEEVADAEDREYAGFEEINLLEGLASGPTFSSESNPLYLPSSRVTEGVRLKRLSQATVFSPPPAPSPSSSRRTTRPIMRKSFRKVLPTVSGFRVRLRTVFVPYVLLPGYEASLDEREAGSNERTVVLCVEVENSGESGPNVGFSVERVDISIGGEDAATRLIGWGEDGLKSDAEKRLFPLSVASGEQYNLLYAVSFLSSPQDNSGARASVSGFPSQSNQTHSTGLQRAVTINILGKPFEKQDQDDSSLPAPTQTFSSKWNCVLDLSANQSSKEDSVGFSDPFGGTRNALPEPASPFPTQSAFGMSPLGTPQGRAGLEIKRHTLPGFAGALRAGAGNIATNFRLSLPGQDRSASPNPPSRLSYTPPSVAMQAYSRSPRTSFSAPINAASVDNVSTSETLVAPLTPAYPAFSPRMSAPPVPFSHPLGAQQSVSGPSVEIRRDRGSAYGGPVPPTPGPTVGTHPVADPMQSAQASTGDPIIVSVGLLPLAPIETGKSDSTVRMIFPSDTFTLDIFVLNRSSWTRRFEISYPDNARQKPIPYTGSKLEGRAAFEELRDAINPPGVLPLQNRIRIGPLRPSTSQSVRMDFTALRSGVHSIDILTLTDIESGFRRNLRSVLDVVVHERQESQ